MFKYAFYNLVIQNRFLLSPIFLYTGRKINKITNPSSLEVSLAQGRQEAVPGGVSCLVLCSRKCVQAVSQLPLNCVVLGFEITLELGGFLVFWTCVQVLFLY